MTTHNSANTAPEPLYKQGAFVAIQNKKQQKKKYTTTNKKTATTTAVHEPIVEHSPSKEQQHIYDYVLAHPDKNVVITAVAGSGKTTTLYGLTKRIATAYPHKNMLIAAFGKDIQLEMESRAGHFPNVDILTFHGLGWKAVCKAYGVSGKNLERNYGEKIYWNGKDTLMGKYGYTNDDINRFMPAMKKWISIAKQYAAGIDFDLFHLKSWIDLGASFEVFDMIPQFIDVERLAKMSMDVLSICNKNKKLFDFDDMLYIPILDNLPLRQYDIVQVDEGQDTNPIQRKLIEKSLKSKGQLIAVGDPYQAIYHWRGANSDALDRIKKQFKCTPLPLHQSFRCPKSIVAEAQPYMPYITAWDKAKNGTVMHISYFDMFHMIKPGEAVLCRYNKYLVTLAFQLIKNGTPAKVEGRKGVQETLNSLMRKWKISDLHEFYYKITEYEIQEREKYIKQRKFHLLDAFEDRIDVLIYLIDKTFEAGKNTVAGLKETIDYIFTDKAGSKKLVILSSIHKAKGLEWEKVYILGKNQFMPSKYAKTKEQMRQENNLIGVSITRTSDTLVYVEGIPENEK